MHNGISPICNEYPLAKQVKQPKIIYCSPPYRGLDKFMNIFPLVKKQYPDVELHTFSSMKIYGQSDECYQELFGKLASMDGVIMHGSITQKELIKHLDNTLIMCYPCTFPETFCLSVVEAMAMGCVAICSNNGALPESTIGLATLINVDDNMVNNFASAICTTLHEFYTNPDELRNKTIHDAEIIRDTYSWKTKKSEFLDIVLSENMKIGNKKFANLNVLNQLNPTSPLISILKANYLPEYYPSDHFHNRDYVNCDMFDFSSDCVFFMHNPRRQREKISKLIHETYPSLQKLTNITKLNYLPNNKKKIRIGFMSNFLKFQSSGRLIRGIIKEISSQKFEKLAFISETMEQDEITADIKKSCDEFIILNNNFYLARDVVASKSLDVIIYAEIGQSPLFYFLATQRLAPLQCSHCWGHPVTSGLDTIDYIVSMGIDSQRYYTENLITFPITSYYYPSTVNNPMSLLNVNVNKTYSPSMFGLRVDVPIIVCVQMSSKITKELLEICTKIHNMVGSKIQFAFIGNKIESLPFINWLGILGVQDFMGLLSISYLALDTFPWCGGITTLDCFSLGIPVVTLPTCGLKGRITEALYHLMNINDCITYTHDEYLRIIIELVQNKDKRDEISNKILKSKEFIFENRDAITKWENFILTKLQ